MKLSGRQQRSKACHKLVSFIEIQHHPVWTSLALEDYEIPATHLITQIGKQIMLF